MKVAIIGAGIAGLACAHELESHGIQPTIYERNGYIGEQHSHVGALLEIMDRPVKDHILYFKNCFGIDLKPLNPIKTLLSYFPTKSSTVKGNLGYFIKRNKDIDDIKNQLNSLLKNTNILYNEVADPDTLTKDFDYVVVADGTPNFSKETACFNELFNVYLIGGVILGEFDPYTLVVWLNKDYCKDGYAYLTPFDSKKAFIGLIVSDVNESEVENYWELFKITENITNPILELTKVNHVSGFVYPHKIDNVLYAGNAGGALSHFLGFGVFNSLTMGVMAGKSIATGLDYEVLLKDFSLKNKQKYQFRRAINMSTNKDFDRALSIVAMPPIKQLIYNSNVDVIKYGAEILKFVNKSK